MMSADWRVMVAPGREYQALCVRRDPESWLRALARPALVAVVIGAATAVPATGHVTWSLILSGAVCWSFAVLAQIGTAGMLIRSPSAITRARAIDLFFLGHAPWSWWLLGVAAVLVSVPAAGRHQNVIAITALVPAVWTAAVIFAFCRQVLQLDRKQAAVRTVLHQALTLLMIVLYFGWAVQLWPRVLASMAS